MLRSVIAGCGGYLPERCVPNAALAAEFGIETSDEWITERTGIRQRHIAAPGETCSSMAAAAARQALERKDRELERKRRVLEATIANLRTEFESVEEELRQINAEEPRPPHSRPGARAAAPPAAAGLGANGQPGTAGSLN